MEDNKLSASEAIYGFCSWLTTRPEQTIMSASNECSHIAELIKIFCDANELDDPGGNWHLKLSTDMDSSDIKPKEFQARQIISKGLEFDPRTKLIYKPGTHYVVGQNVNGKIKWFDK